ncbi:hypothetical protein ACEQ8H_005417 [Pleosporales sp. CAS-2024a]
MDIVQLILQFQALSVFSAFIDTVYEVSFNDSLGIYEQMSKFEGNLPKSEGGTSFTPTQSLSTGHLFDHVASAAQDNSLVRTVSGISMDSDSTIADDAWNPVDRYIGSSSSGQGPDVARAASLFDLAGPVATSLPHSTKVLDFAYMSRKIPTSEQEWETVVSARALQLDDETSLADTDDGEDEESIHGTRAPGLLTAQPAQETDNTSSSVAVPLLQRNDGSGRDFSRPALHVRMLRKLRGKHGDRETASPTFLRGAVKRATAFFKRHNL